MKQSGQQYKNMHTILENLAERQGSKVYIKSPDQGKSITFAQTYELCNRIANFLKAQGIKATDMITLIGENSIETLLIYLGVMNYGAVINPINVEESAENIYPLISRAKPKIVLYRNDLTFDQHRYEPGLWIPYANFDVDSNETNEFFHRLKDLSPTFTSPVGTKDEVAVLVFTSGTTGIPKGVVYSRENVFYMFLESIDRLRITERDVILEYRAYSWVSTQGFSILSSLATGATLVFGRKFSRSRFPSWLKDNGVTIVIGVPAVINMLLTEEVPLSKKDIPAVRFMTSSTSPLSVKNQLMFEEKYGIRISQGAGSTETGFIALTDPEILSQPEKRKTGSIGQATRYKEVVILDEQGNRCQTGEEGEIVVRGKSTAMGYLQDNGEIGRFPAEGIRTGDLGYIDKDGYIYITGRKKELIKRGGVLISPQEITNRIMEHPGVQEAATIGVEDAIRGEEIASFVVPKEGEKISEEEIIIHCQKRLPDWKLPKTVTFLKELPKTERNKVSKPGLVKIWAERQQK